MRLSSPSLAEAFIEGALAQGADVVDCGMMATDMLYDVVATDKLEGGAQITASHNPPQYNGIKMVRAEALPLSGDAGLGEIRDMVSRQPCWCRPRGQALAAAAMFSTRTSATSSRSSTSRRSSPSRASSTPAAAWAAWSRRRSSAPVQDHPHVHGGGRPVPEPRGQSAHRAEPRPHRRAGDEGEGRCRHRVGRRRRSLHVHRRQGDFGRPT